MPSVVHVVTTDNFAGVERYVCDAASETAARGWETVVVGGSVERMPAELSETVRWLPGTTPGQALRSLRRIGRQDICHAHMTASEAVSIAGRRLHQAPVISTRHFAAPRGASRGGKLLAPGIAKRLARQIAVSDFVAQNLERPPDAIVLNGVPQSPALWQPSSRIILVLQRLEREKDAMTALRAWHASRLVDDGWSLRVVGGGSQRAALEAWVESNHAGGVEFTGATRRVAAEFASAGILLAPATAEPFGLAVVEAMAAGVPVVASASGGHLETIGLLPDAKTFPPGDAEAAAAAICALVPDASRYDASRAGRQLCDARFTITQHVDRLLTEYARVSSRVADYAAVAGPSEA